jgi:ribosomal protein L39E
VQSERRHQYRTNKSGRFAARRLCKAAQGGRRAPKHVFLVEGRTVADSATTRKMLVVQSE